MAKHGTGSGGPNKKRGTGSGGPNIMTTAQLVKSLAQHAEVSHRMARAFLDGFSKVALSEVKKNGVFVLPGIGRLVRMDRKARTGRNPVTGQTIIIPAKKVVRFRIAKAAKTAILPPKDK